MLKFFPCLLLCLLLLSCLGDKNIGPYTPVEQSNDPAVFDQPTASELQMDINLTLRQAQEGNSALLAVANDDTTSDSLHLYVDVEVTNVRPEIFFLAAEVDTLTIIAHVSFVDYPHYRFFRQGRIRLVVGQTHTGLQATELFETDFGTDTTLVGKLPLSRIDSFRVADNVAVYGQVLKADRFFEAALVRRFDTPTPPSTQPSPDLVGFVRSKDIFRKRLYVSDATVVIGDTTRFESSNGEPLTLNSLRTGTNELTITALAWALGPDRGIMANGWEFKHFNLIVVRPLIR